MRFGVLGPLTVWADDGTVVAVPGRKVRALLAALLLHQGQPVSGDRLVALLWGDAPPRNAAGALSAKVSQLRRVLEDAEPGGRALVSSPPPGYRIRSGPDLVDADRFHHLVTRARATTDARVRAGLLADALALWRGPAFADLADEPYAVPAAARLEEQRMVAVEDWCDTRLGLGEHALVAGELGDLLAGQPLRERARALHMRALYRAGRQSDALRSYDDLRDHLREELGLDPGPEVTALRQAILTQAPELSAPAASGPAPVVGPREVANPSATLPAPLGPLIGRDDALRELDALLERHRLVTLTGTGGVGKSRLAVDVARARARSHPDGAWWVELAALDRSDSPEALHALTDLVLSVLDVRDVAAGQGRPAAPADRLARALRDRDLLLVLDTCEHLVEPVAGLAALLLRAAPRVRVLATSREPLALPGEVVWTVPPLPVPDPAGGTDVAVLERSDAVRLFVARAAAAAGGFTLDPGNAAAVATVCRRLDGIPLALELAATQVRGLGIRGLIAGLDDRFPVLAARHRGVPPRQRTLLATVEWSWQLLTEPERVVLRRLAAYADGGRVEAVRAVCAPDGVPATAVPDLLARLVDRSLVVVTGRDDTPRYRLLESVAAYAVDRMAAAGELHEIRERAHRYHAGLAERAAAELHGPGQRRWLRLLDAEAANLRGALDGAVRHRDGDLALRLATALSWYWFLRGRFAEARRWLGAALEWSPAGGAASARAAVWHLGFSLLLGDVADWPARHRAAVRRYDGVDDPLGRARAEWFLAYAEIDLGDLDATGALLDELLDSFRRAGDDWGVAATLSLRAKHAHTRGDAAAVARDGGEGAALFRSLGDRWGLLQATEWLGAQAGMAGDYERASQLYREGLRLAEDLGLWFEVSGQLCWLGWVALQQGDYPATRAFCGRGLRLATEQGVPLGTVFAELCLAAAARREGDLDTAEGHLRNLLDAAGRQQHGPGRPLYLTGVLTEMGYLADLRGDPATALTWHLRAADLGRDLGGGQVPPEVLTGLAAACALLGRSYDAGRLLGAATAAREASGDRVVPADRADVGRATARIRAALGEDGFAAAHEDGRRLPVEDVLARCAGEGAAWSAPGGDATGRPGWSPAGPPDRSYGQPPRLAAAEAIAEAK
ncbi:BTAD domain-containing putative transcriptional regulator [Micromonospora costi]|uniref:AfsR/SARP family transcriptional regulator n=1 Tax=Micromonospora costi TaxID=1530042 RepID=A0A3A9ZVC7_9ACTN|nr:BTAD domain-containing putative transcriptional regulator [Micromonospora costi]RKN52131.1 AfsR/SARP family transcriptional regulator [Micromonospora costi]